MTQRLQDELRQNRPFPTDETEALVSVARTASLLDHAVGEALRPYGVTQTQFNVLRILRGAGEDGLCGRDVGDRLVAQVPDVSRLLDRMEEAGLVRRERDPGDRRHVTTTITAEGLRLLEAADPVLEGVAERWFGSLGRGRLRALLDALEVVRGSR